MLLEIDISASDLSGDTMQTLAARVESLPSTLAARCVTLASDPRSELTG
jgi:hypothetical protein